MLSTLAIVIAGVSIVIVTVTAYRNLPDEPIVIKSDHGANGPPPSQEIAIVDHELNLVL